MGALVYRALLRLLPRAFRDEYADAMVRDAAVRAGERAAGGRLRATGFWLRECAGLIRVVVSERFAAAPGEGMIRKERMTMMDDVSRELRFAARRLLRAPGFALTAVLTLALALGAVVSIWAVVKNIVVDPLPYPDSDRLVVLEHGLPGVGAPSGVEITEALYTTYRDAAPSLEAVALTQSRTFTLTGVGDAEQLRGAAATPGLLRVLGVEPMLGRWFAPDAGLEGGPLEVVLSHAVWASRFGGDPDLVGRTIQLSGRPWQVIGILPRGFAFPNADVMMWVPIEEPQTDPQVGGFNYNGIARLRPGADVTSLRGELNALIAQLPERFPEARFARSLVEEAKLTGLPLTLKEQTIGSVARTMWVLLATVGLVLIVACANVANLMLVRSDARQTEVAVRRALGANRRGVATLYLAESLLLVGAGGVVGLVFASVGTSLLRTRAPDQLPRVAEVQLDPVVLLVGVGVCLAVGLVLGLVPLMRRASGLAEAVHEAGRRSTAGGGRVRARSLLMTAQVALACILLVACGLMVRSFVHLGRVDPGFQSAGVLTFRVQVPAARYPERADALRFHDALVTRVAGLPGVRSASLGSCIPLDGWCWGDPLFVEGREPASAPPVVAMRRVGTGYFSTLGIPVRAGRVFEATDEDQPVAVINRELAAQYFPGEDPLGRRIRLDLPEPAWSTIVGVVENTASFSVTETAPAPQIYFPARAPTSVVGIWQHGFTYVVQAEGAPLALVPALRAALRELDPDVALAGVKTLEQAVADSGARIAFTMVLLAIAALTALLLGAIGIYGVLSYSVTRRTGEIGIRMALGADRAHVIRMVLGQGGAATLTGLVFGVAGAAVFARFMDAILFGVDARDPATFVVVTALLAVLALAASWVPAMRAASLDPVSALRSD